ncbi:MarR family winged helix-turn-helix transcriptional regulator [Psychrobacillus vulpis]|uniref:MarR family transcriptional regulator n=1 Tax=Psychrobacillus vulpis TaxID=2325572 RepID=A0A544TJA0_9BACI|nr:MarR family transcriptional regulator [Psychrobacillus vulpis]TQR17534.1 MarR family transcriptional regulator [Psychrobacillus vulpis]
MKKSSEGIIKVMMEEMFSIQNKSKNFTQLLTNDENLSENLVLLLLRLKLYRYMKITEISEAFMLTPGAATSMCDKLEDLNFVERVRIKDDRRVVRVSLTKKGEERVEAIFTKFSKEKLEKITSVLIEINALFAKIEE